jgi:uncharacterized protein (TIGR02099 family)
MRPEKGEIDLQAWIRFNDAGMSDVQVEFRQTVSTWRDPDSDIHVDADDQPAGSDVVEPTVGNDDRLDLPAFRFGARLAREGGSSRLLIDDLVFGDGPPARLLGVGEAGTFRLQGGDLDIAPLTAFLSVTNAAPVALRRWLKAAMPQGRIDSIRIDSDADGLRQWTLQARELRAAAMAGSPGTPGFRGLSLDVQGDHEGLLVRPAGNDMVIEFPGVFAAPITFHVDDGTIAGWRDDNGTWTFDADALAIAGEGFQAVIAGGAALPAGQPPQLDLGAVMIDTDIEAIKQFWPLNRIPNTARWLNAALKGGTLASGRVWVRGPANGFPFRDHDGRLDAVADIVDLGLAYRPDWPPLSDVAAEVVFENQAMRVRSETLRVSGIRVAGATADVADLKQPIVKIKGEARGSGEQLFAFIAGSPLQQRFGRHIEGMAIEGSPLTRVALNLPLKRELGESSVDGRVLFSGQRFTDGRRGLDFHDMDGELRFTRNGLTAEGLKATLSGESARVALRIGDSTEDKQAIMEARIAGNLGMTALFGHIDAIAPLIANARGRADWIVDVFIPKADETAASTATGDERSGWVRVESDLRGIDLGLPAPLAKSADTSLPLQVRVGTQAQARPIDVQLGQLLRMRGRLDGGSRGFTGAIALGGAEPESIPGSGFVITGQAPALDLTGWLSLAAKPGSDAAAGIGSTAATTNDWPRVMLRAGELGVMGRAFRDVDLQVLPGAERVDVQLRGPDIEGSILWPKSPVGRVVSGHFARLHVPTTGRGDLGGVIDPAQMPALDLRADDLRIGTSALGNTRLSAQPDAGVFRVNSFASRSDAVELDATGVWRREQGRDVSDFDIELRADDLGRMLQGFGFAALVTGGRTQATIDGRWDGSPAGFALEKIDGSLKLDIQAGRIVDVDPGVGRIFGLLNLREIPRRLILDFRDFFSQGLRFNSIKGTFALEVGEAYTGDTVLKSPGADILITGRTGLILRDYDQTLEVTPRMGGTLPVVGAIAGGPAGAAAGLVMQGLLRIDQAAKIVYRVSGPWDDPVIVKQEPPTGSVRRERQETDLQEPSI